MSAESSRFWRQLDLCPPERLQFPITVIGAGAIGSAVVLGLTKMGCPNLTVFDPDALEPHNVPNQLCRPDRVGRKKVHALAELARDLCGVEITPRPVKYLGQRLGQVVLVAVDSMDARKSVWDAARAHRGVDLLIDGRMGAEVGRVHVVRPGLATSVKVYEASLYPQAEAEPLPCSARAVVYCPGALAAVMAAVVKRYAMGQDLPMEVVLDLATLVMVAA